MFVLNKLSESESELLRHSANTSSILDKII